MPGEVALDESAARAVLQRVLDPELPLLSVVELGIVRECRVAADGEVEVVLTPTYSGCPATEAIAEAVELALLGAGAPRVALHWRLQPAWTTDWIGPAARETLRRHGIAPPSGAAAVEDGAAARPLRLHRRDVACPRCGQAGAERLSAFGATACKALYRCLGCREPFEYFKPI
ncbi:1,2-phenylacetyl-CoA epoxidase subunit PaaD [Ideonella sakaiensis]|uniref:Phenylacetate-CoA oxygenase, PaaJ subunit n=1 Tax=Piscinibacter sakaiensis TaxID=1547922 RepID=A0A0K8NWJ1_PISS1|nr:phenylacetate-CoA oxygenase, PaaJ subunit [Piscinibacter sakaiensis]